MFFSASVSARFLVFLGHLVNHSEVVLPSFVRDAFDLDLAFLFGNSTFSTYAFLHVLLFRCSSLVHKLDAVETLFYIRKMLFTSSSSLFSGITELLVYVFDCDGLA